MTETDSAVSVYLDSSALVKLIRDEPGSRALRALARSADRFVSELSVVELRRFAHRISTEPEVVFPTITRLINACEMIFIDQAVLEDAGSIRHRNLGTLDAIHLATAVRAAPLDAFITYDLRQADAAHALGLEVVSPG